MHLFDRFVYFFAVCGEISVTIYSGLVITFQLSKLISA